MSIQSRDSFLGWCRFALAKEFYTPENNKLHVYSMHPLEKAGHCLRFGIGSALDLVLREIKNPIMIVALTAIAAFVVTVVFYPVAAYTVLTTVVPLTARIKPWMLKMALYIAVQSTVLGVGLRALGRFYNDSLMQQWTAGAIAPLYIGSKKYLR